MHARNFKLTMEEGAAAPMLRTPATLLAWT